MLKFMINEDNKTFCILPWIHLEIQQGGEVYPCCRGQAFQSIGNLNHLSIEEIWNTQEQKELRLNMLAGKRSRKCYDCYNQEKCGGTSPRLKANENYSHLEHLVDNTKKDGALDDCHFAHLGIRFSNLCNYKCRYCYPHYSTKWISDANKLGENKEDGYLKRPFKTKGNVAKLVQKHFDTLESLYIAGGEPLLENEHIDLLKLLIESKKTEIRLHYDSNFSTLKLGNTDIIDLWDHFKEVQINASLDGMGKRAEYIRFGQNWDNIIKNRIRLKQKCPKLIFSIIPTITVFNTLHFLDFIKEWLEQSYVQLQDINVNILEFPLYYNIQSFPYELKVKIKRAYVDFIKNYLLPLYGFNKAMPIIKQLKQILVYMNIKDLSQEISNFKKITQQLDEIRNENFYDTFPELKEDYMNVEVK